jgi:aspartate 1-decarboxylase
MAFRCFLQAKIHRAVITEANVEYNGSIAICPELLQASGLHLNERVDVYNIDNGNRLTTYVIQGRRGEICLNGAAARQGAVGERVIIAAYAWLSDQEARQHRPKLVFVDGENRIVEAKDG